MNETEQLERVVAATAAGMKAMLNSLGLAKFEDVRPADAQVLANAAYAALVNILAHCFTDGAARDAMARIYGGEACRQDVANMLGKLVERGAVR